MDLFYKVNLKKKKRKKKGNRGRKEGRKDDKSDPVKKFFNPKRESKNNCFAKGPKNLPPSCRCQPWHTRSTVCECVHKVRGLEGCVIGRGISQGREKGSGSLITRPFTT